MAAQLPPTSNLDRVGSAALLEELARRLELSSWPFDPLGLVSRPGRADQAYEEVERLRRLYSLPDLATVFALALEGLELLAGLERPGGTELFTPDAVRRWGRRFRRCQGGVSYAALVRAREER